MVRLELFVSIVLAAFIADTKCQRLILPISDRPLIIRPTYRPPITTRPIIRTVREVNDEPQWLWKGDDIDRAPATGDHPVLPSIIDDINIGHNRRYARNVDSPSAKRHGGSSSSSGHRDTGPTHPGYNRRNTRSIYPPGTIDHIYPPRPTFPNPWPRPGPPRDLVPTYYASRTVRDIHIPGMKKPTYRDVIIPNWNPNVRSQPWGAIGGRKPRSVELLHGEEDMYPDYYDVIRQQKGQEMES